MQVCGGWEFFGRWYFRVCVVLLKEAVCKTWRFDSGSESEGRMQDLGVWQIGSIGCICDASFGFRVLGVSYQSWNVSERFVVFARCAWRFLGEVSRGFEI